MKSNKWSKIKKCIIFFIKIMIIILGRRYFEPLFLAITDNAKLAEELSILALAAVAAILIVTSNTKYWEE